MKKYRNRPNPKHYMAVPESSNIYAMQYYAPGTTLWLVFKNKDGSPNDRYRYEGITNQIITEFIQAESKGSYLAKSIKGKYEMVKET